MNRFKGNTILIMVLGFALISQLDAQKPNILFIAVDDMNCDFGAYGNREVHSPNIDDIANEGVLFYNNHCQQPVCGASRASLLSGFTPDHTGVTGFYIYLRDLYPDIVTLPQFFKNEGYTTVGMGKIHDPRNVSETDGVDLVSWSNFINITGSRWLVSSGKPITEMADLPDNNYVDGMIADEGVNQIKNLSGISEPFFLAVGFKKPHLPFVAPKKYWDMYDRDSISLAPFRKWAENDIEFVHNPGGEFFNSYDNVPAMGTWSYDLQREYIHGYYACVSFIDEQVGRLINELKVQGVYENTIIVLWGDHGFSLGDHTNWGKHTNFEYATRSPLIIRAPGMSSGAKCEAPTEHLDIYPTLVDLAGFAVPDTLDGTSLLPILDGSTDQVKSFAVSRYKRGGNLGYSLRSNYYQYVEWTKSSSIEHQQLFNLAADPYQTVNLFAMPEYEEIIDTFSFNLNRYLDDGNNTSPIYLTSETDSLELYNDLFNVSFSVSGKEPGKIYPLSEAEIKIGKFEFPTSTAGYASMNKQAGTYTYDIHKENFWPASGTFDIMDDMEILDTLLRRYFQLTIKLVDSTSQAAITGLDFEFDGQVVTTALDGTADFNLEAGTYDLHVQSDEYLDVERSYEIVSDTLIVVKLRSEQALIKFKLNDGGVPVSSASVILNGEEKMTNAIGIVNYYDQKVDSSYTYIVNKEGYIEQGDSFILKSDTIIELDMKPFQYSAEIIVVDTISGSPIENAEILFNDSLKITDDQGSVIFYNMPEQVYSIEFEKEGYQAVSTAIEILSDTVYVLRVKLLTSVEQGLVEKLSVYPNPARNYFLLKNGEGVRRLTILNINGQTVLSKEAIHSWERIGVSGLDPGFYMVKINSVDDQETTLKLFIDY